MNQKMRRNIFFSYWIRALRSSLLMIAILVPFFNEYGLSQFQVAILQGFFFVVIMLFETPSGYVADIFGRKKAMLTGACFGLAGMSLYTVANSFAGFMIVEALLGIGLAMFSGADTSLVYDSFAYLKEEDKYLKYQSRSRTYGALAETLASIVGGSWLVVYGFKYPFYGQVLIEIALIYCVIQLTEPPRTKIVSEGAVKDMKMIVEYCLKQKQLKWLIAYFAITTNITHTVVWIIQPMYAEAGVDLSMFGYIWAGGMLVSAASSRVSVGFENLLGRFWALASTSTLAVIATFVLGWQISLATLPVIYLFNFVRGISLPILDNFINELTDSSVRATVNSLASFVKAMVYIPVVSTVGYMADVYSLQSAMLFSGIFYSVLFVLVGFFAYKSQKN